MEDNNFTPTFTGAPRFRLPFRSVYVPVVPCVLDGCLSLLELIAKLEYIVNQYHDAIEQNHTDIMALYEYFSTALTDLREYIDTQDAAMLAAANAALDAAMHDLAAYVDAQDAATLQAAKNYADTLFAGVPTIQRLTLTYDDAQQEYSINTTYDNLYLALLRGVDITQVVWRRLSGDTSLIDMFAFSHIDADEAVFINAQYKLSISAENVVTLTPLS